MSEHDLPSELERRLEEEAANLLCRCGPGQAEEALWAECGRRRRRRRARTIAGVAAGLLLLAAAAMQYGQPAFFARSPDPVGGNLPRGPETPGGGPGIASPDKTEGPGSERSDPVAGYPFVILVPDGDRHRVIAAGIYLPEFVERVDPHDLTPAEREGIRRVLGARDETSFQPL
jgi:hypothetical protein